MPLTLAAVFGPNMVLQRDMAVPVWGTAAPGAEVTVAFQDQRRAARADADGRWRVDLAPLAASARPAELTVSARSADGEETRSCHNVLVGEVWVCSGQSNMAMAVADSRDAEAETAAADYPAIRLFTVPNRPAAAPVLDLPGAAWSLCTPASAARFSAVGYFFGREVHQRLGVPVGLIHTSWGGTPAEAWTSYEGLRAEPALHGLATDYARDGSYALRRAEYDAQLRGHEARTRDAENRGFGLGWAGHEEPRAQAAPGQAVGEPGADIGGWKEMTLPGTWQSRGLDFHGVLWFRKAVEVPAAWAGRDLELSIGATDKSDTTYFNGEKVGGVSTTKENPDGWAFRRTYRVPGRLVKPGRNVIAVRVHSDMYAAGMTGPAEAMKLACPDAPEAPEGARASIPLAGTWRYAVEANYGRVTPPPLPAGPDNPNSPSVLFNGMIAPLLPFAVRGAIWYQGESNVERAEEYRTLFPAMIHDWRRAWGHGALAFHFVQLANFMAGHALPTESRWAELREAQAAALSLPHTGMAVAIDVGDAEDIHPRNKQDIGRRLAWSALHTTYGLADATPSGPRFREAKREGRAMRVAFDYAEGGLVSRGGEPCGFALAGEDRAFAWAEAMIEGDTVRVAAAAIPEPRYVRYAWADNPACNLYNAAGLPAAPFRTDSRPASPSTPD